MKSTQAPHYCYSATHDCSALSHQTLRPAPVSDGGCEWGREGGIEVNCKGLEKLKTIMIMYEIV